MDFSHLITQIWDLLRYQNQAPLLFNQASFLLLFTLVLLVYPIIYHNPSQRNAFLALVSFYFYYKSSGEYVLLLLGSTLFNYLYAFALQPQKDHKISGYALSFGIIVNLIPLFYFKYTDFFRLNLHWLWGQGEFQAWSLFLPVGISFFTFQAISYLVDVHQAKILPCRNLIDFGFYLSFFPQLVAGPIVRAIDFLPQVGQATRYTTEPKGDETAAVGSVSKQDLGLALFWIAKGLIKKIIFADYLAIYVTLVFQNPQAYSGLENLLGVYAYTLQIYCDFSGYSDMAIGLALILGFRLPENFRTPYQSLNITEFWRRWHISLSFWLRDYIYIALGGNRKGVFKQYLFLMITMLVGGWWHGASWKFVFWGGMHGLALAGHKYWLSLRERWPDFWLFRWFFGPNFWGRALSIFLTFHFVAFLWIFFRATDFSQAWQIVARISSDLDWSLLFNFYETRPLVIWFLVAGYFIHRLSKEDKTQAEQYFSSLPTWFKAAVFLIIIQLALQLQDANVQPFIYYQF